MQNSHIRQHFIPQFILRNFSHDQSKEKVFFHAIGDDRYSSTFVSNVFMEQYLYSKVEDQATIEESLAEFEASIAPIFKKFNRGAEISLTFEEDERLRIFLSLLAFRSVNTRDQFGNLSDFSKLLYSGNAESADMKELWLENVRLLSQCRSMKEVLGNPEINSLIKSFIRREFSDFYMCLLERRGNVDFHISDCYPTVVYGESELPNGQACHLPIYYFYPLSESRMIVLVTNYIKEVRRSIAYFDPEKTLKGPKRSADCVHLLFRPARIYTQDVEWINEMIAKNAKIGIVVKNLDRYSDS